MPLSEFLVAHEQEIRDGAVVYLPVNPIEYHGPHLSLMNDHLISVGLARGYTGEPARSSPEAGAAFAHAIIDRYVKAAEAVLYGDDLSPRPIFSWLDRLPFTPSNPPVPLDSVWQPTAP